MRIRVNDEDHEIPEGSTILDLLRELDLEGAAVAVAVATAFVPRSEHGHRVLADDDDVEVLAPMQGG